MTPACQSKDSAYAPFRLTLFRCRSVFFAILQFSWLPILLPFEWDRIALPKPTPQVDQLATFTAEWSVPVAAHIDWLFTGGTGRSFHGNRELDKRENPVGWSIARQRESFDSVNHFSEEPEFFFGLELLDSPFELSEDPPEELDSDFFLSAAAAFL